MVRLATNVTDPIGDMLTRIRNANIGTKDELLVPASKMNQALAGILAQEGYIESFAPEGEGVESVIRITLKYGRGRERTITGLKRVSAPGDGRARRRDHQHVAGPDDRPRRRPGQAGRRGPGICLVEV